ncbi:thermostable hemolysin [Immundisolibacter sp.]|uniref:thermostable hemolysin n=1 Tax=Immundisolibacter sp. TaxID=1934948 RepID=UPI002B0C42D7|nr:thermostable hemolysin [Immundisolibacter sp.]MEA3220811.1 hypothetical protein [Immundisolibacter sp.]
MQSCANRAELAVGSRPAAVFDVHLYPQDRPRAGVEDYIARRYAQCHEARVSGFMPWLLAAQRGETFASALGFRPAGAGALFLERYLEGPVEGAIASAMRQPVQRGSVVEIGNLAATSQRASRLLITLLVEALHRGGFRWIVFTATRQVRELIRDMGFALRVLAPADPARLGQERAAWGRYYDAEPMLTVGDLAIGCRLIRRQPVLAAQLAGYADALDAVVGALW